MAKDYSVSDIKVMEGLEAVRMRPGMYIGSTGVRGLHHMLWEIVDNAVDEAANGYADRVQVTLHKDQSVTVEDTGPGFSAEGLARGEQAFYTSDASRPQEGHMGMGLYFAAQTAKRHGGALHLANTGLGARAELVLPIN